MLTVIDVVVVERDVGMVMVEVQRSKSACTRPQADDFGRVL